MRTVDSRSQWLDLLIVLLKFLLTLLSGASGVATWIVVSSDPGVRALGLGPDVTWFWILLITVFVLAVATWAFQLWRKGQQDTESELLSRVLDFVEWVLDSLKAETGKLLREIPRSVVEEAAKEVYRTFIQDTPLGFVPEDVFVDFVVRRWEQMAGVQATVRPVTVRLMPSAR